MHIRQTSITGLYLLESEKIQDSRGFFCETYHQQKFLDLGIDFKVTQDNISLSHLGTIRGLHFQKFPFAQAKLITLLKGRIFDVTIDLRPDSPTYLQRFETLLDENGNQQLFIPKGVTHGFLALSENTIFNYKCDQYYNQQSESGIFSLDPELNIKWPISNNQITMSKKDKNLPGFKDVIYQIEKNT